MKSGILLFSLLLSSSVLANNLDGVWDAGCTVNKDKKHRRSIAAFETKDDVQTAKWIIKYYAEADCKGLTTTDEYEDVLAVGETTDSGVEIDLENKSLSLTYHDQAMIDEKNKEKHCGFEDWKINEPKIINGLKCGESTSTKVGEPFFWLYKFVDVEGKQGLRLGLTTEEKDGTTKEKRPDTINEERTYFKEEK